MEIISHARDRAHQDQEVTLRAQQLWAIHRACPDGLRNRIVRWPSGESDESTISTHELRSFKGACRSTWPHQQRSRVWPRPSPHDMAAATGSVKASLERRSRVYG